MRNRLLSLFLSALLLMQGTAPLWAFDAPKKTFYEKSGWLDHRSNTMRRVAERGEAGAYDLYKNNNPAPRNQYERANIHEANLSDLAVYKNSDVYRRAKQIRDIFLQTPDDAPSDVSSSEEIPAENIAEIRGSVAELMGLYAQYGERMPIVTQAVLEVARELLPLQKQFALFAPKDLPVLHALYTRILSRAPRCGQGGGYRLFCEGRADAFEGFALLAAGPQDAELVVQVLLQDLQQPFIARELLLGASVLLTLGYEERLERVLQAAVDKEGETFWQKIDVFMTGWWIKKIQFSQGRYLGNVSGAAVLTQQDAQADTNAWEELARLLYNEGRPTPASARLLARYGLGACEAELFDVENGRPVSDGKNVHLASVRCRTLLPFLVGALSAGVREGATESLAHASAAVNLSAASYAARLYFENVMGDISAETELRIDGLLYDVFERDLRAAEEARQKAVARNRELDAQIAPLRERLDAALRDAKEYYRARDGRPVPEGIRLNAEISALEKQKTAVPALPDAAFEKYDRDSRVYKRKVAGQRVYGVANTVSFVADLGLGIYYTAALGKMLLNAGTATAQWGASVRRGLDAVRAGRVNADARRLAALAARIKNLKRLNAAQLNKMARQKLSQTASSLKKLVPVIVEEQEALAALDAAASAVAVSRAAGEVSSAASPAVSAARAGGASSAGPSVLPPPATALYAGKPLFSPQKANASLRAAGPKWDASAFNPKELSSLKDPARWESLFADVRQTRILRQSFQRGPEKPGFPSASGAAQNSAAVPAGPSVLPAGTARNICTGYFRFLAAKRKELPWWNISGKRRLSARMRAALAEFDAWSLPTDLEWNKYVFLPGSVLRQRAAQLWGSPLKLRDRVSLWFLRKRLYSQAEFASETAVNLRLGLEGIGTSFKKTRGVLTWGPEIEADALVVLPGLRSKVFVETPIAEAIAKGFTRGRENLLFVHGHGIDMADGWRFWTHGFSFSKGSETLQDILRAAARSGSSSTSVYLSSCQSGRAVEDFLSLTAKEPLLGRNVRLFTPTGYKQLALGDMHNAAVGFSAPQKPMGALMYEKIINNGEGLAGRAVIDGKVIDPLAASIEKLSREIDAAPYAARPKLRAFRRELTALKNISVAENPWELALSLARLERVSAGAVADLKYPPKNLLEAAFHGRFGKASESVLLPKEYMWGVERLSHMQVPFVRLKKPWVDYVAETARELYGLPPQGAPPASGIKNNISVLGGRGTGPVLPLQTGASPASAPLRAQPLQSAQAQERAALLFKQKEALAASGQKAGRARLTREIKKAVDFSDGLQPASARIWPETGLAQEPALRLRLKELAREKKNFTPLQEKEFADLNRLLYSKPRLTPEEILNIQTRMDGFLRLEKTPNAVFALGEDYTPADAANMRMMPGFFRPLILQRPSRAEIFDAFKANRPNLLILQNHAGVSKKGFWKGVLRGPLERPADWTSAETIMEGAQKAGSAHTYVYIYGCRSGWLVQDLRCLRKLRPDLNQAKTDWFISTARYQLSSPEVLPEFAVAGTARERLFGKMLNKIRHNGDGLASHAVVDGKDIYPLKRSVQKLTREIKKAPEAKRPALQTLRDDLQALLDIADARNEEALFNALSALNKRHPGGVRNFAQWDPDVSFAARRYGSLPVETETAELFRWGLDKARYDAGSADVYVTLKPQWVDYVAHTAEEAFASLPGAARSGGSLAQSRALLERFTAAETADGFNASAVHEALLDLQNRLSVLRSRWEGKAENLDLRAANRLMRDGREYVRLDKLSEEAERTYNMFLRPPQEEPLRILGQGPSAQGGDALKFALMRHIGAVQKELAAAPGGAESAALLRRLEKAWDDFHAFLPASYGRWDKNDVVPIMALRMRLREISARKDLTPLQRRELASLKKEIYGQSLGDIQKRGEIQMRLMSLPFAQKTPNTVWLQGGGFDSHADQMVNFKTPLGFLRPRIMLAKPLENVLPLLRRGKENVLFADLHGYVSRDGIWKGVLVPAPSVGGRPLGTLNMPKLLDVLQESGSSHTYTYLHSCQSGCIFEELPRLFKTKPSLAKSTEWYTPTARMQSASYETLPETSVLGTARERLLDKLLLKINRNGDGLASRALIEGKEIYPLKEAVRRAARQAASAPAAEQKAFKALHADLQALLKIADAKDEIALFGALERLEKLRPGSVSDLEGWRKIIQKAREISADKRYLRSRFPTAYMWGKKRAAADALSSEPFVRLKPEWVDYVAQTAREMFAGVAAKPQASGAGGSIFKANTFEPVFASETARYIALRRDLSLPAGKVPESFFHIPAQTPAPQSLSPRRAGLNPAARALLEKEYAEIQNEFIQLRHNTDVSFYYARKNPAAFDPHSRSPLVEEMRDLRSKILRFQRERLSGKPLQGMADWLDNAVEVLLPGQRGHVLEGPVFPRPDRVYSHQEFFLHDANGRGLKKIKNFASGRQKRLWLESARASLPAKLRVAVLNDDPDILFLYKKWLDQGVLGKTGQWSFYKELDDFAEKLAAGEKFDLIITDLNLPGGSARYFVSHMRVNGDLQTPVIASSSFPPQAVDGAELLGAGFDGYFPASYLRLPDGEVTLLRALNNYYKYQGRHGWIR